MVRQFQWSDCQFRLFNDGPTFEWFILLDRIREVDGKTGQTSRSSLAFKTLLLYDLHQSIYYGHNTINTPGDMLGY